ncbi:MAG: SO2930 family diheme c-type cytochrome [Myxococcota bacterium]
MKAYSILLTAALAGACSSSGFGPINIESGTPPELLSELNLIAAVDGALVTNARVEPYTLNTPLFSDYAVKDRHIYVPEGQAGAFDPRWTYAFPEGSAILKTFSVAPDLREPDQNLRRVETRVLLFTEEGWTAWPYLWNEEGTDAELKLSGKIKPMQVIDRDGNERSFSYLVPQRNQCQECHEIEDEEENKYIVPIGPSARNLDDGTQLQRLEDLGVLEPAPAERARPVVNWSEYVDADFSTLDDQTLDVVARDYLDVNCAHCHNDRAVNGQTSQLFLAWDNTDLFRVGLCKKPGSAAKGTGGRSYDIVPGNPDQSILHYRMQTDDVGSMMPDIGRSLVHDEGVALIREWIARMPADDCVGNEE